VSYSLTRRPSVEGESLLLKDDRTGEFCEVLPRWGGTVHRLCLDTGAGVQPVLACDEETEIASNPKSRGRLLFPWNDRIPEGRFVFEGQTHQLAPNKRDGSAIHGLIRDLPMELLEVGADDRSAWARLGITVDPAVDSGYPFTVRLEVRYRLSRQCLRLEFHVRNLGDQAAPVALGWHPYFVVGSGLAGSTLELSGERFVEVGSDLMPTGVVPPVSGTPYDFRAPAPLPPAGLDELDIAIDAGDGVAVLEREGLRLSVRQDPARFAWFQLYTPPDGKSIAIEPVTGATDAFNRPELGRIDLAPGAAFGTWCEVVAG